MWEQYTGNIKKYNNFRMLRGDDGAAYRTRTCDPRITNAMLYQLS